MTATIERPADAPLEPPEAPTARPSYPPMSTAMAIVLWVWVGLALLSVWAFAYAFGLSAVQEQRSQQKLYAQFHPRSRRPRRPRSEATSGQGPRSP